MFGRKKKEESKEPTGPKPDIELFVHRTGGSFRVTSRHMSYPMVLPAGDALRVQLESDLAVYLELDRPDIETAQDRNEKMFDILASLEEDINELIEKPGPISKKALLEVLAAHYGKPENTLLEDD